MLPAAARPAHSRCGMLPAACRGEHGSWSKSTNFELDVRTPLIIRAPWISESVGKTTLALAELVDLFPTAVALAGLPAVSAAEGLEGTSLVPVLKDPGNEGGVKIAAYSQYPRCPQYDQLHCKNEEWECLQVPNVNITRMGQSLGWACRAKGLGLCLICMKDTNIHTTFLHSSTKHDKQNSGRIQCIVVRVISPVLSVHPPCA